MLPHIVPAREMLPNILAEPELSGCTISTIHFSGFDNTPVLGTFAGPHRHYIGPRAVRTRLRGRRFRIQRDKLDIIQATKNKGADNWYSSHAVHIPVPMMKVSPSHKG